MYVGIDRHEYYYSHFARIYCKEVWLSTKMKSVGCDYVGWLILTPLVKVVHKRLSEHESVLVSSIPSVSDCTNDILNLFAKLSGTEEEVYLYF